MRFVDGLLRQLTVANQLTFLRLLAVPAVPLALLSGSPRFALGIFLVAGVTDALDGLAARRLGQQTPLGAVLDPIADKLIILVTYVALSIPGRPAAFPSFELTDHLPAWLTLLVVLRDLLIVIVCVALYLAHQMRRFPPSRLGKATTALELATASVFLVANGWPGIVPGEVLQALTVTTAVLVVGSGVHYSLATSRDLGRLDGPEDRD